MKKVFLAMMTCMAACTATAASQWHTDPAVSNLLISSEQETGAGLVHVKETADGKFWVTWLSWQDGMNGYIKAQLLDKEGNALLDEGGVFVMKKPTASWTSNYGMDVTPDGCLVVCHSDCEGDPDRHAFYPHVYKMDQEGNQLWGLNGVELPTSDASGHRPKVIVTGEGSVMVGYNDINNAANTSEFVIYKFNDDGTLAWADPLRTGGMFGAFEKCEEDDVYMTLIGGGAINLYRINSLGDYEWDSPIVVESRDPNTRSEVQPLLDGQGGVVIPYQRYINLSTFYTCMQRVSPDGETCLGLEGLDLNTEPGQHSAPGISLNGKRGEIAAAWNYSDGKNNFMYVQKYDYYGTPLWDEPREFGGDVNWGYATTHGTILDDGSILVCYSDKHGAVQDDIKVMKLDSEGNKIWIKQMSPVTYCSEPLLFFDEPANKGYIFMSDNRKDGGASPSGGVYGQDFLLKDQSESIASVTAEGGIDIRMEGNTLRVNACADGVAYVYDTLGALAGRYDVQAGDNAYSLDAAGGLYIVRVVCGSQQVSQKVTF